MECVRVQVESSGHEVSEFVLDYVKYIGIITSIMLILNIFFMTYVFFRYIVKLKIFGKLMLCFYLLAFI